MAYLANNLGYNTTTVNAMTQGQRVKASDINGTLGGINSSVKTVHDKPQGISFFIPAGLTYSPCIVIPRNVDITHYYTQCQSDTGTAQNPTSLTFSIYKNGSSDYTSSAITTASTNGAITKTANAGDNIYCVVSNTTGLTGGIAITLKVVNK